MHESELDDLEAEDAAEKDEHLKNLIATFDQVVCGLENDGFLDRRPTQIQKAAILKIAKNTADDCPELQDIITEHFPQLLSESERESRAECDAAEAIRQKQIVTLINKGHYTVPQKRPGEPAATPKQLAFLQILGETDNALLADIGKAQASSLIQQRMDARENAYNQVDAAPSPAQTAANATANASNATAVVVFVLCVLAVAVFVLLWLWA